MRKVFIHVAVGLLAMLPLRAEEDLLTPAEVLSAVDGWMEDNIEDEFFDLLALDREAVREAFLSAASQLHALESFPAETTTPSDSDLGLALPSVVPSMAESLDGQRVSLDAATPAPMLEQTLTVEATPELPSTLFERWLGIITNRAEPSRAKDYLPTIQPIFRSARVPEELAWLAEVESAFDPHAKSPAGAVGLFQLMPETANSLGLSTWLPDERRSAEKNTKAAARYLNYLYNRFDDWQLALAAYNAGPTRVARLLRKNAADSYSAIAQQLPSETRDYVAKVEATLLVREGVQLASLTGNGRGND